MALNEPWSIKSRAHVCSVTEQHFEDGEAFYTALFPDPESSGYLRKDFSKDAWEKRSTDEDAPFSFWGSTYHAPVKEEEVEVTDESPEDLLRRLIEEDEEHTENARYILAVMLERKKQLIEADSQPTATGIIRIYEQRKTGDVFIVKDPNIPLSEIEQVQEEVTILLENGGRVPEPEKEEETETNPTSEESSEDASEDPSENEKHSEASTDEEE
ncbi:MAG: hypothetical protein ACPG6P_08135 [Akkermansiaceae bacterium]